MKAVLIGVSDRSSLWRHGSIKEEDYVSFVKEYAKFLKDNFDNVIVTPDDGVYTDIAIEFGKLKGKKPIAFYPDKDTFYGFEHLKSNFSNYDLKPINGDWYKLNADLTKQSLTIICLGFSPGVLIGGSFIKYHQKYGGKKDSSLKNIFWLIDERCIEQRLPKIFEEQINNIHYYSDFNELKKLILKQREVIDS